MLVIIFRLGTDILDAKPPGTSRGAQDWCHKRFVKSTVS